MTATAKKFDLFYRKQHAKNLPSALEKLSIQSPQNYVPLYTRFFALSDTNYNSINLNQRHYITGIESVIDTNNIEACLTATGAGAGAGDADAVDAVVSNKPVFIKYSPLLDPIKYLSGKYDISNNPQYLALPQFKSCAPADCHEKSLDPNNSAYVDAFFSYLTSQTLHHHGVIHGLDFYGSHLCIHRAYAANLYDDIDYLAKIPFFNDNRNVLFTLDCPFDEDTLNPGTRQNKRRILATAAIAGADADAAVDLVLDELPDAIQMGSGSGSGSGSETCVDLEEVDLTLTATAAISEGNFQIGGGAGNGDDSDTCSSRSSNTDAEEDSCDEDDHGRNAAGADHANSASNVGGVGANGDDSDADDDSDASGNDDRESDSGDSGDSGDSNDSGHDDDYDDDDTSDDDEYDDDDNVIANIHNFPVQAIALEKCKGTLDELMMDDALSKDEWCSALMQIIMTLVIYQKMFAFTHNDLHTNNVMYVDTNDEYVYYKYDGAYYKVPTFGRIYKIIDFGRAIYRFNGVLICSDSFHENGDAATQYNCEPYYNPKKAVIEPNYSFDLCRLACSLFDYFVNDLRKVDRLCKEDPLVALVVDWTKDDKGRNVLYKSNGDERYPDFKLYKMIARTVHLHTPERQLQNALFSQYAITHKKFVKLEKMAREDRAKAMKNKRRMMDDDFEHFYFMNVDALPTYVDAPDDDVRATIVPL